MGARWVAIAVGVALATLAALFLFNGMLTTEAERSPRTWVVQPGDTLTLTADEIHADDRYRCTDDDEGVDIEFAADGSATVTCGGPPAGY
jgi:hypothetical protein